MRLKQEGISSESSSSRHLQTFQRYVPLCDFSKCGCQKLYKHVNSLHWENFDKELITVVQERIISGFSLKNVV